MRRLLLALALIAPPAFADVQLGPRPGYLVESMPDGPLKGQLQACEGPSTARRFSIGHRGAPLTFPEHTEESYRAAARMGAGILECDVTFTADLELVCRHSQNDLHTTTNIPGDRSGRPMHSPVRAGSGCRMPDVRPDAGRVPAADRQDGRSRQGRADGRGVTSMRRRSGQPVWMAPRPAG